jgi:hypothetical protein
MCTQKPPHDYSEQLYAKYREAFNTYISDKVSAASPPELDPGALLSNAPCFPAGSAGLASPPR